MALAGRPNEPFFWGRGGQRRSAEDISLQRRLAAQQMAQGADTSPVGHWLQGAGRLANGLAGGMRMNRADQADDARSGELNEIAQLLMTGGQMPDGSDPVAAALAFPELAGMAQAVHKQRTPEAPTPTEFARLIAEREALPAGDARRAEYDRYISSKNDADVTVTLPGGGIFVGPRSELANVLQGAPTANAPSGPPPEAIQELLQDPSPDAMREFDEVFGAGQAQSLLQARQNFSASSGAGGPAITRQQAASMIAEKGQAFFDAWAKRNNVTVGN